MSENPEQLVTPDSRKRIREESSPTSDSSPSLSPPCKRMPSEFVDNLLAALDDERICKRLGDIISHSLRQKVEDQEKTTQALETKITELENCQKIQESLIDDQEQYSGRECVRIWTDEKEENGEDTDAIVLELAKKMEVPLTLQDVSRSHRVGRPGTGKPRAIICRFASWRTKRRFMKGRTALKKTKIFVSDDLTKARSHLFYLARQKKTQGKCVQCWTFDGKIFLKKSED